jgi:polysaccharide biosynthesis protein PslH
MTGEILFLCHRIPFPPDRGDKIRSFHILKRLAEIAPVHVGCFADDDRDMGFAAEMEALTASQCVLPRNRSRAVAGLAGLVRRQPMLVSMYESAQMHRWVQHTMRERPITAVMGYSAQMAHFIPDLPPGVRFVMDFVDFDSAKYAAYGELGGGVMGWVNRREGRLLRDFERIIAGRACVSAFVSEAEAELFRTSSGFDNRRVIAIDNGVALDYFNPAARFEPVGRVGRPLIVFTGQMDYRPNIEAVDSFAHQSLPALRAIHPDACFAIVGRNPAPQVEALKQMPGVIVTGSVPDVRGWLAAADVVVAPLRIARGIQNKVLEAMAMARPVVASPEAAEGIDARDGEHFLIAADPAEETEKVAALLADPGRAQSLGQAARARMEERYRWSETLKELPEMLFGQRDRTIVRAA